VGNPVAGFEIMELSPSDRMTLRNFIRFLVLSESGERKMVSRAEDPIRSETVDVAHA
jgi:hypothetical protein